MTTLVPAPSKPAAAAHVVPIALLALAALYALTHPFTGFLGDAQIYMGRALADNDPAGVGRDLMFRLDGQSRFSIFPPIAAWLVAHMSLLAAAMCIVAASSLLWFLSALALARAVAPARSLAVATVVILAPTAYGGFNLLRFAEALAEPRPFAEAFVLFALAAFLVGRRAVAFACLAASALFHPIMALAGIAALWLDLCVSDRRWLIAAILGALAIAGAALLGAPLFDRLGVVMDGEWLDMLARRNAYLFPHLWPSSAWAMPLVQAITIVIAARNAEPRVRRLLLATLAAGALGVTVAYVAARFDPVLLVMQAQFWRMWWLAAVLAALALGLRAIDPEATDGEKKLALALLALSWALGADAGLIAPLIAGVALWLDRARTLTISHDVSRAAWLGACAAVLALTLVDLPTLKLFAGQFQPDFRPSVVPLALKFLMPPLLFGAVALAAFGQPRFVARIPRLALGAASLAFAGAVALVWNDASSFDRRLGASSRQPDLEAMLPNKSGETLWLYSSLEPWVWLGRPGWSATVQGAGGIFSRELALTWRNRAQALIQLGALDARANEIPYQARSFHPMLDRAAAQAICARPDAPGAIIFPVRPEASLDPALKARIWTPPAVRVETLFHEDSIEFPRIDRYAIVGCADQR
jgi:hypothetical protein